MQSIVGNTRLNNKNLYHALFWMFGAVTSFSMMAVAGREIYSELNTFELLMYRAAIGFIIVVLLISISKRGFSQVTKVRFGMHFKRNVFHFTGQNFWFYGVAVIPFSQMISLEFTSPIWVALLAPIFVQEAITKPRIIAALLGFVGVIIVAQPGITPLEWGHAAGLLAALCFAVNTLYTKQISKFESVLNVLFWMTLLQTIFGFILSVPGGIPLPTTGGTVWVLIVSVCGLTAHLCLTNALKIAPATLVAPLDFIRLPVMIFVGASIYSEPIYWSVIIGALIIFIGNYVNINAENKESCKNVIQ